MKTFSLFLVTSMLLLSACGSTSVDIDTSAPDKARKYNEIIQKDKDLVDPVHGVQTKVVYGAISGVSPTRANGIAFLRSFSDGMSTITVNVNILKAPEGERYSVVLKNIRTGGRIDVGSLESILGDTRHSIELTTKESIEGFSNVSVYLDKKIQAEGMLKEVSK